MRRSQFLPFGGNLTEPEVAALAAKVEAAYRKIWNVERMQMDAEARQLWQQVYPKLSEGQPGLVGAVTNRAEAQTIRLALIYALLDGSREIKAVHLQAALALWQYCADSVRHIFGDSVGDPVADDILRALRGSDGLTRTAISDLFGRNQSASKIGAALAMLVALGKVEYLQQRGEKGRPRELWRAF